MYRKIEEADASRRTVLRGALAAGCSLLLPAAVLGCSKKDESAPTPTTGTQEATPPASGMESAAPAAPAKVSQASVQYQMQPKGDQKCANCMYFIADSNTCQLVEGEINPEGWCLLWVKKA